MLLFAYSIFGIGCLCCGLARNIDELIAARVNYSNISPPPTRGERMLDGFLVEGGC